MIRIAYWASLALIAQHGLFLAYYLVANDLPLDDLFNASVLVGGGGLLWQLFINTRAGAKYRNS